MSAKLDAASMELARSMDVASIPEKLRCATCDKLAINAMKLPCCDNTICGDCHDTMSATECPICTHTPFSADMCVTAKGLQMTIKAFIKTERKKRGAEAAVLAVEPSAETPADNAITGSESAAVAGGEEENVTTSGMSQVAVAEATADNVNESEILDNGDADQDDEEDEDDDVVITTEMPEQDDHEQRLQQDQQGEQHEHQSGGQIDDEGKSSNHNAQANQQQQQQNFGFDPSMGNFGNGDNMNMNMNMGMGMGMNGFNGMMPGFGMGMPNMMGMPGMGMDPSMMFNGNFGGNMGDMGMMGMGMGMSGMGNGMMGGGMGNFGGMGGPGFFPDQGNYMQSNYGNAPRQNFSNDRGYGRGFGRGFGRGARGNWNPRGRGGSWGHQQGHQQQNGFHQPQNGFHQQHGQQNEFQQGPQQTGANSEGVPLRRPSPVYDGRKGTPAKPGSADDNDTSEDKLASTDTNMRDDTNDTGERSEQAKEVPDQQVQNENSAAPSMNAEMSGGDALPANGELSQIQSVTHTAAFDEYDESAQNQHEYGYGHQQSNFSGRGGYRGRGGFGNNISNATELTPAPAPPVNAPKGPKAMLQGFPNTGWSGRNLAMATPPKKMGTPTPAPQSEPRMPPNGSAKQGETTQEDYQEANQDKSASRSHSRRRSRSPMRDDDQESDVAYPRRKESDRHKRKDREQRYDDETEASKKKYRSRSESRNGDGSRHRHRDKDDEQYRSSRSHRDRSRDRERRRRHERDEVEDRDEHSRRKSKAHQEQGDHKDSRRGSSHRHSRRDDDQGYEEDRKERSHRSSRHDRSSRDEGQGRESGRERERERDRPRAVIEPPSDELGFKIKGSKSARAGKNGANNKDRRSSVMVQSVVEAPAAPPSDIYAAERAAQQDMREAREMQRRGTTTHPSSLGKRGRDEDDAFDAPRGPKGDRSKVKKGKHGRPERKISYKYEDEVVGGDVDRDRWR